MKILERVPKKTKKKAKAQAQTINSQVAIVLPLLPKLAKTAYKRRKTLKVATPIIAVPLTAARMHPVIATATAVGGGAIAARYLHKHLKRRKAETELHTERKSVKEDVARMEYEGGQPNWSENFRATKREAAWVNGAPVES